VHAELCREGAENSSHSNSANFLDDPILPQLLAKQRRSSADRQANHARCSHPFSHPPHASAAHAAGGGGRIRSMPEVVHMYASSSETCPVCAQKCANGGGANAIVNQPVIRPVDWEIELNCAEHGFFRFLGEKLMQSA
jgi:hypothetical protein